MKWCCEGLRRAFEERHERGIFVFCEPVTPLIKSGPTFWLGTRSVRLADREQFNRECAAMPASEHPLPIMLATWRRITFCPWCGCTLERYYRKTYQNLVDQILTEEHGWEAEQVAPSEAQQDAHGGESERWDTKMNDGQAGFCPAYRGTLALVVTQQTLLSLFAGVMDSGGVFDRILLYSLVAFWVGFIIILVRRPRNPTETDIFVIKWGTFLLLLISVVMSPVIWALRGAK